LRTRRKTLGALIKFTELDLSESHVGGDAGELRALVHLAKLCLDVTQVTWDVTELRVLVSLKELGGERRGPPPQNHGRTYRVFTSTY